MRLQKSVVLPDHTLTIDTTNKNLHRQFSRQTKKDTDVFLLSQQLSIKEKAFLITVKSSDNNRAWTLLIVDNDVGQWTAWMTT